MKNHRTQRLLLFDIDGTLVLTRGAGRASTQAAMLEVFGTVGALDSYNFDGKTDWLIVTDLLTAEGFTSAEVAARLPAYQQAMRRHLERVIGTFNVEACRGALEAVRVLRRHNHLLMGLVTGNVAATAPIKLRAAGFDPAWFPVGAYGSEAISRDDLPPLALERAMRHWNCALLPQQVVVIGDTATDVACARALGAVAVAVRTGFASEEELRASQPDYLLDDLKQLAHLLDLH
jgi:phosphoglycolate phosphatase-like HAD superfamily hydrolase